jgi:RNA polymerase sigma-70 factor (ECF subfamily)
MEAYRRYGPALIRKASRMLGNPEDARDIVQALFTDLFQDEHAILDLPYLYRAVTNRCLTFMRDEKNRARLLAENAEDALAPPARTLSDERAVSTDLVVKLVRELDDGHCEVLAYRFLDDMTQDEIAELLGLSRKTIGKRLDRIREAVAALMAPAAGAPS